MLRRPPETSRRSTSSSWQPCQVDVMRVFQRRRNPRSSWRRSCLGSMSWWPAPSRFSSCSLRVPRMPKHTSNACPPAHSGGASIPDRSSRSELGRDRGLRRPGRSLTGRLVPGSQTNLSTRAVRSVDRIFRTVVCGPSLSQNEPTDCRYHSAVCRLSSKNTHWMTHVRHRIGHASWFSARPSICYQCACAVWSFDNRRPGLLSGDGVGAQTSEIV